MSKIIFVMELIRHAHFVLLFLKRKIQCVVERVEHTFRKRENVRKTPKK